MPRTLMPCCGQAKLNKIIIKDLKFNTYNKDGTDVPSLEYDLINDEYDFIKKMVQMYQVWKVIQNWDGDMIS